MNQQGQDFEEEARAQRDRACATAIAAETMRPKRGRPRGAAPAECKEKMPLFWQVFGGTLVSVVAVIAITVYTQMTSTELDLRRNLNQVQAEMVTKEDVNTRSTAQWTTLKELRRQLEETNSRLQVLAERLASVEATTRQPDINRVQQVGTSTKNTAK